MDELAKANYWNENYLREPLDVEERDSSRISQSEI